MKKRKQERKPAFEEYEALIRQNAQSLYAAAYAVKGEREGAEKLCEDTLFYGAKRSLDLVHKERILDILYERIGAGASVTPCPCDTDGIISGALARAEAWLKRRRILMGMGLGVLTVLLCIGIALPFMPENIMSQTERVILMENAQIIKGDNDSAELVNYQQISKTLPMNEEMLNMLGGHVMTTQLLATVTAPDGTPYAITNHLEAVDGSATTFTFYRGYKGGWDPIATGEIGNHINHMGEFWISEMYLYADADSNIYVFIRLEEDILIYKYDCEMETFEKKQTIPFQHISYYFTVSVAFDLSVGEKGVAYIAGNWAGSVKLWRYDVATDTLSVVLENIEMQSTLDTIDIIAREDIIYLTSYYARSDFMLYRIYPDGTVEEQVLFEGREQLYSSAFADDGTLHIAGEYQGHYIITPSGEVSVAPFEKSYYQDTDYESGLIGFFRGSDGGVYALEFYRDSKAGESCFIAYARLDDREAGRSYFVNGFDMLDNYIGMVAPNINGNDVAFSTYAYHDDAEMYFVYFHLSELGKES
ncbi:MAG: hypothetical protein J6D19_02630 [Clostridia bacterium]|nr:hypothetical protein [Clostridia bacterium]